MHKIDKTLCNIFKFLNNELTVFIYMVFGYSFWVMDKYLRLLNPVHMLLKMVQQEKKRQGAQQDHVPGKSPALPAEM